MAGLNLGKARSGVGLLEVSLGLAITALAMGGFAVMQNNSVQAQRAQAAGGTLNDVHEAARSYVQANRATLLSSTSVGGAPIAVLAGRTSAAEAVPAGSLQAAGLLPAAWVDRNSYGHRHVVLIRQPTAGNLEMMVIQSGGQPVRPADLTRVASRAGAAGGFVPEQNLPSAPTTHVTGMGGGWAAPRTTWTSGSWQPQPGRAATYAFFPANASENGTFLSRVNTGNPDDTRMQTSIDMGGNSITGAGQMVANEVNATGNINTNQWVGAQQGLWTAGQANVGGTVYAGNLHSNNSMWVTNGIDVGSIGTRGTIWANGWIDGANLNSRGDMWAGHIWSRSWLASDSGIWTNGVVIPRGTAPEGGGCGENGMITRSPTGDVLSCQGGQWRRPSAQAFSTVHSNYWSNTPHYIYNTNSFFMATNYGQVIAPGMSVSAPVQCGYWYQGPEDSVAWCLWYQSTNIIIYR